MRKQNPALAKWVAIGGITGSAIALLAYVGVKPSQWWTHEPVLVSLVGVVHESTDRRIVDFRVSETNANHDYIGTNTKSYSKRFHAADGYVITAPEWREASATRVSDMRINTDGGGESVTMDFKLKAGPKTDRYRGWVHGTLRTTQVRTNPRVDQVLAEGIDATMNRSALPPREYKRYDELWLVDQNGKLLGNLAADEPAAVPTLGRSFRLSGVDGTPVLESVKR